ncbi:MAG: DEAD/DEAH box helicase [Chthoniobacterales bacterium]
MSVRIRLEGDRLVIEDGSGLLHGRHYSQLLYWGFKPEAGVTRFVANPLDDCGTLDKLLSYFERHAIPHTVGKEIAASQAALNELRGALNAAVAAGAAFKDGDVRASAAPEFLSFLSTQVPRKLKPHQIKAALHLLAVTNGANFSVPGSGKTTVVLAVYEWLKQQSVVDALFVVGPPSCFGPWQTEFREVLGHPPRVTLLAGGCIDDRRVAYNVSRRSLRDLYVTSFQTMQRDWEWVRTMFVESGARFFFVVDEAHYMKQLDGAWATAVLNVAPYATRRCVLTGTPFPRTFSDAFNLFDALWPQTPPLSPKDRIKVEYFAQKKDEAQASSILGQSIGPLFYRVRKQDLGLAPQQFHPPIMVPMAQYERLVYDSILDRLRDVAKEDEFRDWDLLVRLRRGRMIRLRQAISYTKLLASAVVEYEENLLTANPSLADIIKHYDELEVPAKLLRLTEIVAQLRTAGEKVLIWSNFVQSLKLIAEHLAKHGHGVRLIYGETPTEKTSEQDEETREQIIRTFLWRDSGIDVLVANPAACAESISLHKSCAHAVYYDLSYNCAQYLQSLDRIHRVGGSEEKIAHYYFLQYADSVDRDVLNNVQKKAAAMSAIIDRDYPIYDLDMFSVDDELTAYERLFG